jgi:hypothetical protein
LALVLCESAGPPTWVVSFDPMLEELAASLVVIRPMGATTPECLPTQEADPQVVEAPVVDTYSLATATQWMTDLPLQLTPPWVGPLASQMAARTTATRCPRHAKLPDVLLGSLRRCSSSVRRH